MDITKSKIAGLIFLLGWLFASGAVNAQHKVQAKPSEKLFMFKLSDNNIIAVDGVSRRFYRTDPAGNKVEMSFDEVIAHAEPDPAKRPALMAQFEAALASSISAGYWESASSLQGPMPEPEPCNPVCEFSRASADGPVMQSYATTGGDEPPTDLDGVTVIGRRPSEVPLIGGGGGDGMFWSNNLGAYNQNDAFGGGSSGDPVTYQQYWADDYKRFQREKLAACEAATVNAYAFGATMALTIITCGGAIALSPAGGAGPAILGAACFAESILTVKAWGDLSQADKQCSATYLGPGSGE